MAEVEVEGVPKPEFPVETHKNWVKEVTGGLCLGIGSTNTLVAAANFVLEARTLNAIEKAAQIAQEIGGTITPQSLQAVHETARLHHTEGILSLVAASSFFAIGTIQYFRAARSIN